MIEGILNGTDSKDQSWEMPGYRVTSSNGVQIITYMWQKQANRIIFNPAAK